MYSSSKATEIKILLLAQKQEYFHIQHLYNWDPCKISKMHGWIVSPKYLWRSSEKKHLQKSVTTKL